MNCQVRDITGVSFGRLVARALLGVGADRNAKWLCTCDCGESKVAVAALLRAGRVRSCGCLRREIVRSASVTHGQSRGGQTSRTYSVWAAMKQRCVNPKDQGFANYGGRGIALCDRWHRFENFLEDMGEAPAGLSIDRIDNDCGYEPGNCRWATRAEQNRNRRGIVWYVVHGARMVEKDAARAIGFSAAYLSRRRKFGLEMPDGVELVTQ